MRRFRNTKILATLGPASSDKDTIRALFDAGADVFRLNFSHGSHEDHRKRYDTVRAVEAEFSGNYTALLRDGKTRLTISRSYMRDFRNYVLEGK